MSEKAQSRSPRFDRVKDKHGSKEREQTKKVVRRVRERIKNRRHNFVHQQSRNSLTIKAESAGHLVREQTGKKMPSQRTGQVYSNLSSRRRRDLSEHGVERVNKYEFEINKVSNDGVNPPFCLCIEKIAKSL